MSAAKLNRRDFLVLGGTVAAGCAVQPAPASKQDQPEVSRSRVVLVRSDRFLSDDGTPDTAELHRMLDEGVAKLFEVENAGDAWRRVVTPEDVVGIKSNVWKYLPTPPALEERIRQSVLDAGVKAENISVDDRGVLSNPVFQRATALVNIRPMRSHHWSGLGTCIKNLIMFVPRPQEYHGDACASLGALWTLPAVAGKVRLNVLVMLTPQFHGVGAHSFSKEYVWPYGGLIVGTDPVAVDATGARIINAKREQYFGPGRPITPPPHHIEIAGERYGLGVSDPERIDIIRLGPQDDALI
jgi:hypothetical protein